MDQIANVKHETLLIFYDTLVWAKWLRLNFGAKCNVYFILILSKLIGRAVFFHKDQDRHWKTARHEKIEASELKPSEEKKSIMVWSLSNLTTEIRPGKHLENPTKNGTNANRNLWNLNTLYTALWDFWWMGFWIKKFPLDWNPKKKGARQSTKTPPSDRKSRWVHGIGWPFFFFGIDPWRGRSVLVRICYVPVWSSIWYGWCNFLTQLGADSSCLVMTSPWYAIES